MMKRLILLVLVSLPLWGCDSGNAWDCIQDSGELVQQEYDVDLFKKIQVWERVQLIIQQGNQQSVRVQTGANLIDEIQVVVEDSTLKISNRNSCNYVRDYDVTKVFVSSPDIREIRSSSGLPVKSLGTLGFDELSLISNDPENLEVYHHDGDFDLDLDVILLRVQSNGLSNFFLRGKAQYMGIRFDDGDPRLEGADLIVNNINVFQRSTNKIIVNPQVSIIGEIRGLGDIIALNRPPIVEVEEFFRGRLIFQ
ncbi:MAG: DUF2807 domain-containing protein [Bacteroidia bacterium]|nr:DUF2807 domain-containing protein [Bacteroidia bacterium]NNF31602.1 DUF2807 domain-containing protein [Flavobacteriaceae bacterium]MBT8275260.1 DUF2807 domain-containing protein [Bacteroidia bacterium]NNJ83238.1 DUF2807 domain-containing protein [Flavobacteriaceae bacterium]NNK53292.1 DUF2807 domain-containing protein [Flavobacteriaceae bacterium]